MKILFYINSPSSYQFEFYESLKKIKINFHVIFYEKQSSNFNWRFKKHSWYTYLNKKNKKNHFIKLVNEINPNFIVLGGYNLKFNSYLKKTQSIKKIYWLERVDEGNLIKKYIRRKILSNKLKDASAILAIGSNAQKFYSKFNKNVFNLPYSIFPFYKKYKKKKINTLLNFIFVGQLIERKGLNKLIHVLENNDFKNSIFTFVGDGPLKKKIKKICFKKKNIKYLSFVNKKKLDFIYGQNDILILLSTFDGWGVVVVEAMSKKLAVISNNKVGASLEFIKNKRNGIIVNDNEQSIVNAINYCSRNINKIREWGTINRNLFQKSLCNSLNASNKFKKIITSLE